MTYYYYVYVHSNAERMGLLWAIASCFSVNLQVPPLTSNAHASARPLSTTGSVLFRGLQRLCSFCMVAGCSKSLQVVKLPLHSDGEWIG